MLLEANCVLHWVGVMLSAMEQFVLLPLFHCTPTPLGWTSLWLFWMRQGHCASEIPCATKQEIWSKTNVHPGLFTWITVMSHYPRRFGGGGGWTTSLSFAFIRPSKCWSSRPTVLSRWLVGAACIWMWTAISIARLSTQAAAMRAIARFILLDILATVIWYCRENLKKDISWLLNIVEAN